MMGNVVIWKPSDSQVFSAQIIIEVFKEAGVLMSYQRSFGDALMVTDLFQVVTSQDYTLQVLLTYLKISKKLEQTSTIIKHTQNCWGNWRKRFHHCSL
jgi:hypothetical protein